MARKVCCWAVVFLFLLQLNSFLAKTDRSYFQLNGTLKLRPSSVSGDINSILWRHKTNLVAEWVKDTVELQYYGAFTGRTELNTATGYLEIAKASGNDTGEYSVEINNLLHPDRYNAVMILEVPEPYVWVKPDQNTYVFYCDPKQGSEKLLAGAAPVTYRWKIGDGEWMEFDGKLKIHINETTKSVETFTCKMVNPVSEKASKPEKNPFFGINEGNQALAAGLGVGILSIVLLCVYAVAAHKKKWFPFSGTANAAPVSPSDNGASKASEGIPLNPPAESGDA